MRSAPFPTITNKSIPKCSVCDTEPTLLDKTCECGMTWHPSFQSRSKKKEDAAGFDRHYEAGYAVACGYYD